jgi:hypothetical protein
MRAIEPSFDGGAARACDGTKGLDGFDREGEAGEVAERNGWYGYIFGARCGPTAI